MTRGLTLLLLVAAAAVCADELPGPLVDRPGDAEAGRSLFVSRDGGHCILCHRVAGLEAAFQGNVGPDLTGIAMRRTAPELRARIMDPTRFNPEAAMPAYFRRDRLQQVAPDRRGETLLTGAEIEDLVAWLMTLDRPR